MRAKDLLSNLLMPLKPTDSGTLALNWMEDMGLVHLPVVDGGNYIGIIKNSDIYGLDDPDQPLGTLKLPFIRPYVYDDQHFFEVLRLAATDNLTAIPVLDHHNSYKGSITRTEIIQTMANYTTVTQPGGIIVLEMNSNQYSLGEISRIIEGNDAKVLSVAVTSPADTNKLEVTIKVNVMDLSSIIQTFNRYDYIIKASFSEESSYDALLNERYESLMKFLET